MKQFLCGLWGHWLKIVTINDRVTAFCPRCSHVLVVVGWTYIYLPGIRAMNRYPGRYIPGPLRRFLEGADCMFRGHAEEWELMIDRDALAARCRTCRTVRLDSVNEWRYDGPWDAGATGITWR